MGLGDGRGRKSGGGGGVAGGKGRAKRGVKPRDAPEEGVVLTGLTVFLSVDERAAVVKRLRGIDADRRVALLRGLGVEAGGGGGGGAARKAAGGRRKQGRGKGGER